MVDATFVLAAAGLFALVYVINLYIDFKRYEAAMGNLPGYRVLLSPATIFSNMIPFPIPFVTLGRHWAMKLKHDDFERVGKDVFGIVSAWPRARGMVCVADAAALKEITLWRARWPKPVEQYALVLQFGRNIVATEGHEWRKHRKIANPAFSEPNNKLVWEEAVRVTLDMINNVWKNQEEVVSEHAVDITLTLALLIIGSAGFGRKISFAEDVKVTSGHQMSFKDALHVVSTDMVLPVIVPSWAMGMTERLRRAGLAMKELQMYMQEMIDQRRASEKKEERHDLFTLLLDANMEEDESGEAPVKLTDSELIGNIFIFLLAGHETTAHTLCFTLALLALYQDEQEILYQHVMSVLPDKRLPTYEDMGSLTHVLAAFYETLRMFPPVTTIPKKSAEDTTLVSTNAEGERTVITVPAGCGITIHTPGLHYNPRYWKDPHTFKPSRFLEDWPRDAFLPFSGGARSCIGRRFSETESLAILSVLIARYKIEVKEEPQFASETFEQRKERLLASKPGITTTPIRVPLVFKRRD